MPSEKETTGRGGKFESLGESADATVRTRRRTRSGAGGRWSSFLFIIPGSFGVVPFRQRAGNFSLLLATSRYVRYYVREKSAGDRETNRKREKERGRVVGGLLERRGLPADIKDIPCWQTNATVSLLQLRQSHLLISLSDNPLSSGYLRTNPRFRLLVTVTLTTNPSIEFTSVSRERERVCRYWLRFYATHVTCYVTINARARNRLIQVEIELAYLFEGSLFNVGCQWKN